MNLSDLFGKSQFVECDYVFYASGTNITDSVISSGSSVILGISYRAYSTGSVGGVVDFTLKNGTANVYQGYMGFSTAGGQTYSDRNAAAIKCPNGIRITTNIAGNASLTVYYKIL